MSSDINLIKQTTRQRKNIGKIMLALYVIFGLVFLGGLAVVLYSFSLEARLNELDDQKTQLTSQINTFQEQRDSLLILGERLSSIQTVIANRGELDARLNNILGIVPSSILVESIAVNADGVYMRLESNDLAALDSFLEADIPAFTAQDDNKVKLIEIGSFSQLSQGYVVSLDFYYTDNPQNR